MKTATSLGFIIALAAAAPSRAQMREMPGQGGMPASAMFRSAGPAWAGAIAALVQSPWTSGLGVTGPISSFKSMDFNSAPARASLAPAVAYLSQTATAAEFAVLPQAEQARRLDTAVKRSKEALAKHYPDLVKAALDVERRDPRELPAMVAQLEMMRGPLKMYFSGAQLERIEQAEGVIQNRFDESQRRLLNAALSRHAAALAEEGRPDMTLFESASAVGIESLVLATAERQELRREIALSRPGASGTVLTSKAERGLPAFPLAEAPALPGDGSEVVKMMASLADVLAATPNAPWVSKRTYADRLLKRLDAAAPAHAGIAPVVDSLHALVEKHGALREDKGELQFDVEYAVSSLRRFNDFWSLGQDGMNRGQRVRDNLSHFQQDLDAVKIHDAGRQNPQKSPVKTRQNLLFGAGIAALGFGAALVMPWIIAIPAVVVGILILASIVLDKLGYQSWLA